MPDLSYGFDCNILETKQLLKKSVGHKTKSKNNIDCIEIARENLSSKAYFHCLDVVKFVGVNLKFEISRFLSGIFLQTKISD